MGAHHMEQTTMQQRYDGAVVLFDERGRLIGTIPHPRSGEPTGPGRETVYLSKAVPQQRPAAA
jgi:hypothetical protein